MSCGLDLLPANLSGLANLKTLLLQSVDTANSTVNFAGLATIPNVTELVAASVTAPNTWLWRMTSLKVIDFFNAFVPFTLDEEIGNMVNLESLDVWATLTTQFPSTLSSMIRLKNLRLRNSDGLLGPSSFPPFLVDLPALEFFYIEGITVTGSFPDLGLFPRLRQLQMFGVNGLSTPPSLVGANSLEHLSLYSIPKLTSFPTIPDSGLPSLKSVEFSILPLISQPLPVGFYNSTNLESFLLSQVPTTGPFPDLSNWPRLRLFIITGVALTSTLIEIPPLMNLSNIAIQGAPRLSGSFIAVENLPKLLSLQIADTRISAITVNASNVPTLFQLYVIFNLEFFSLPWLTCLSPANSSETPCLRFPHGLPNRYQFLVSVLIRMVYFLNHSRTFPE
jgi:hypothetical protein